MVFRRIEDTNRAYDANAPRIIQRVDIRTHQTDHRQSRRTQSEPRNRIRLNVNCHHAYVFSVVQPASDLARIIILRHHLAALQRHA